MDNLTPRPLYPSERYGTYCIGGWVDDDTTDGDDDDDDDNNNNSV